MWTRAVELFLLGMTFSFGPCAVFCGPVILSFIGATKKDARTALSGVVFFLLARLVVYVILGMFAAAGGNFFLDIFSVHKKAIFAGAGFIISVVGIFVMMGKYPNGNLCRSLHKKISEGAAAGPVILGILAGIAPCLPLLGVMAYIAFAAKTFCNGALLGLAFGIGGLISPLILMGAFAGLLSGWMRNNTRFFELFQNACGFILFLAGLSMIFIE